MKRQLIFLGVIFLFILFLIQIPKGNGAIVSDDCGACHGLYPQMIEEIRAGNILCVNCHSNADRDTIKTLGGVRVPIVYNTVKPLKPLAGGNFYYVARDFGDRRGHNVDGITSQDAKFRGAPPGYNRAYDPSIIGYNPERPLTCAGSNGCHGNRNIKDPFEAVYGTHHAVDKPLDGSTTAKSYRYLKNTGKIKGVEGLEDDDWGDNSSSKKHNEYSPMIDNLCKGCHGDFHSMNKTGPWFRHPTGISLPRVGEYAFYNPDMPTLPDRPDIRIYNTGAPVGRKEIPDSPGNEVNPGKDIVICLSCHVAHSSPYESILRWDYDAIVSGEAGKGGCFICHTGKGE
ncbi:MAG: cytochrome c3 family protein [Nitrospirota bacterium]